MHNNGILEEEVMNLTLKNKQKWRKYDPSYVWCDIKAKGRKGKFKRLLVSGMSKDLTMIPI